MVTLGRTVMLARQHMITREKILELLRDVKDPEIPALSIVDLGMVRDVTVGDGEEVTITLTPTFVGCPALEVIEETVSQSLTKHCISNFKIKTSFDPPWNSNMISQQGREKLKESGIAPPRKHDGKVSFAQVLEIECPFCGSRDTEFKSLFGSALCRSIHYCNNCLQSFEQFKPLE